MLIAEALAQRAALQRTITDLTVRAEACAVYTEGEEAHEDVNALLDSMSSQSRVLGELVARINAANIQVTLPTGETLTQALARRDALDLEMKNLRSVTSVVAGTDRGGRYGYRRTSRSELADVSDLDVSQRRSELDDLSRQRRELDMLIQQTNWVSELPE